MKDFLDTLLTNIGVFITSFGFKFIGAIVVLLVGMLLIRWFCKSIAKGKGFHKLPQNAQLLISNLLKGALYVVLFITIAMIVGVPAASLVAVLGSCGLAIGLALQGGLSNIAGGIILLCTKPFDIGDFIDDGSHTGTVTDIGLFYTTLKTPDNKRVVIPNGTAANATIIDYSAYDTRRLDIELSVKYDSDIEVVKETLLAVANAHELVLKDPAPFVRLCEQGKYSLKFKLRVWVNSSDYWTVNFDLLENTKKVFDKCGIEIPFPQLDVHQK